MNRILLTCLLLSACGGSKRPSEPIQPPTLKSDIPPSPSPTPTPKPTPKSQALIGQWADAAGNTLEFKDDGTVINNKRHLNWSSDGEKSILFTANDTKVDFCDWELFKSIGINSPLTISLHLNCETAGKLTYTRVE